ncbi:MAG: DUF4160 domain-containing protein [Rhodospirillales bacterium]
MPTIQRFGASKICLYADDHRPPHFHIVGREFQVLVAIGDLTVIAGRARAAELAEAMEWARQNRALLARRWAELNERDA